MKLNFDIDDKDLQQKLQRAMKNVPVGVKGVVAESSIWIQNQAQELAPKKTRNLSNSIVANFENDGMTGVIGTPVHYAVYQEFGTYKMHPTPFLFPSWEMERPRYLKALEKVVKSL